MVKPTKNNIIVMMDADLSHKPEDIKYLIEPLKNKNVGLVIASRSLGGSEEYDFVRAIGNIILTNFCNFIIIVSLAKPSLVDTITQA